jgi:predicted nucleic acid-binding protein
VTRPLEAQQRRIQAQIERLRAVEAWCRFPVQVTTLEVMRAVLQTRSRFGISHRDAEIVEAGRALGCSVVLSEDLDHATDQTASAWRIPSGTPPDDRRSAHRRSPRLSAGRESM